MKHLLCLLLAVVLLTGCTGGTIPEKTSQSTEQSTSLQTQPPSTERVPENTVPTEPETVNYEDMKAIWLSQYDLWDVYLYEGVQRNREDFAALTARILDNIRQSGFNTVFLQVRPNGDSMYPSEVYPVSKYVAGSYGGELRYDPVAVLVSQARERGLSIHAWINPMRCMKTEELEKVSDGYRIRQWYDDPEKRGTYLVSSGAYWYLNPAYEEVRRLILAGAAELLQTYDFDGLHMDDYFYPTTEAVFDAQAFETLGGGKTLEAFRRENLNILVSGLYALTKAAGESLLFGISPAGNIQTVYGSQYADVYTWCANEGYVDYICPQVYFGMEHLTFDFVTVCNTWQSIVTSPDVALIVGMTFEKALSREDKYAGSGKTEWEEHRDVLKRCLEYTAALPKCRGISVFSYQHFYDPVSGVPVAGTAEERENFLPVLMDLQWQR